jgi:hypothetical protein
MDISKFLENINITNNNIISNKPSIIHSNKIWNDKLLKLLKEYNDSSKPINNSLNNNSIIIKDINKLTNNLSSLCNAADSFVCILYLLYSHYHISESNDDENIVLFNLSIIERHEILIIILNTFENVINMLLNSDK